MTRLLFAIMLLASPAAAQNLAETLMQPGLFADVPGDDLPCYAHDRTLTASEEAGHASEPVKDGKVCLTRTTSQGQDYLELSLANAGQSGVAARFPAETSNPVLLFFLENVVRNAAVQTGGSPYYIRNRIREALTAEEQQLDGDVAQSVLHPFDQDPNRARLGDFADLVITLRFDAADPAQLLLLSADTGDGANRYTETLSLLKEE